MRGTWNIWLLLGVLWLFTLPLRPLFDPDEGRYAEIPREMVASGDWVTPRLNGLKYFEKPPLQYWTTAALYSVFGTSEWTSRFWAAALGFMTLPVVFVFASKVGYSRDVSVAAAAILAISPLFLIIGQVNLLDQAFSFLLVSAVFAFALAQLSTANVSAQRRWMLVTWALLALAVLSKGIVALVLAGATVAVYMLVTRSLAPLRQLYLRAGLPLFALIVTPWFVLVQRQNPEFANFFFVHEHVERYLTAGHEHSEPWWYFIGVLLIGISPFIGSFARARRALRDATAPAGEFQAETFLLTWCAVVLVFFSLSGSKLAPYVLPMLAPLALILAQGVAADSRALRRAALTLLCTLCLMAAAMLVYAWKRNGAVRLDAVAWATATVVSAGAAWWFVRGQRAIADAPRWMTLAAASIFGYQALIMCYASLPPVRTSKSLAQQIAPLLGAGHKIYSVGQFRHTLAFYLGRTMEVFDYRGELEFGLTQAGMTPASTDIASFRRSWTAERDALAVVDPKLYLALAGAGLPGRVVARDARSVVVSRR